MLIVSTPIANIGSSKTVLLLSLFQSFPTVSLLRLCHYCFHLSCPEFSTIVLPELYYYYCVDVRLKSAMEDQNVAPVNFSPYHLTEQNLDHNYGNRHLISVVTSNLISMLSPKFRSRVKLIKVREEVNYLITGEFDEDFILSRDNYCIMLFIMWRM